LIARHQYHRIGDGCSAIDKSIRPQGHIAAGPGQDRAGQTGQTAVDSHIAARPRRQNFDRAGDRERVADADCGGVGGAAEGEISETGCDDTRWPSERGAKAGGARFNGQTSPIELGISVHDRSIRDQLDG
jgi:hypothetical protein